MQTKSDYIEGTTRQLDLWGSRFATLGECLSRSRSNRDERLEKRLEALRKKRLVLKRRLREAAHTSQVDWKDVRDPLEDAVQGFRMLAAEVYDNVRTA